MEAKNFTYTPTFQQAMFLIYTLYELCTLAAGLLRHVSFNERQLTSHKQDKTAIQAPKIGWTHATALQTSVLVK
jgi:hypothetical protein